MDDSHLKILIADPHSQGGGQVRYVATLARALTRFSHSVTIACRPGSVLTDAAREADCALLDRFTFRGGLRPRAWGHDLWEAMAFIRRERPHILHVNGSQDHWTFALANRILGCPACLVRTRHNTYKVGGSFPNRLLNRHWTDYQIVVCDAVRRDLAAQRTFDPVRMCTLHNGVDPEKYTANPETRARARAEFGYADENIVCGIVARLVEDKGHQYLFRAVAQMRRDFPELRVLCMGQGVLEPQLRQLAEKLGIADIVRFAGFRNDIPSCLQALDLGVQPSIGCEASPFSVREMMSLEIPMIVSDYGGLRESVSDGVEGLVVRAAEVEPLAAALRRLLSSPEARARMGRMGRRRVMADFSEDVFARRTEQAYRRAMGFHRQRRGRGNG